MGPAFFGITRAVVKRTAPGTSYRARESRGYEKLRLEASEFVLRISSPVELTGAIVFGGLSILNFAIGVDRDPRENAYPREKSSRNLTRGPGHVEEAVAGGWRRKTCLAVTRFSRTLTGFGRRSFVDASRGDS